MIINKLLKNDITLTNTISYYSELKLFNPEQYFDESLYYIPIIIEYIILIMTVAS